MKIFSRSFLLLILTIIMLAVGTMFWLSDLSIDPPMYFSGLGQSLSTDPACCVYHARNMALFDNPDPFDYSRFIVIQRSLTSLTAHVWFSLVGVSLERANTVGILLSIGGLIFFLLAVSGHHRPWVVAVVALCYLINVNLIVHGRLSYLENGLIFITSLLFFVYSWWGNKSWGLYVSGALVAAAMLLGKLFGALLLPALMLSIWFAGGEDRIRKIVSTVGSFVIASIVLVVALYGTNLSDVFGYFSEQSYGLRGFPEGLSSPWGFVEHLISYGIVNRLFVLNGDIYGFLWWGSFLLTILFLGGIKTGRLSRVTVLSMFAVACIFLGLSPLNYSPVRYALFLLPVSIIFCFGLSDYLLANKANQPQHAGYARYILLFLVVWRIIFHLVSVIFYFNETGTRSHLWISLPFALGLTYLGRHLTNKYRFVPGRKTLIVGIIAVLFISVSVNVQRIVTRVMANRNISIKEANTDISEILGENAVVSGPYGPVLTMDNNLKSFIHYFGVADVDSTLFERYPITHLAIDESNVTAAVADYPFLEGATSSAVYFIRDCAVRIFDISHLTGNREAAGYKETSYEKAARYLSGQQPDSAYEEITKFLSRAPRCRSANIVLAEALTTLGRFEDARRVLTGLAQRHPTDYYTNIICARSFQRMGLASKNSNLLALSRKYYEKAVKNNPYRAERARRLYMLTQQQFGAQQGTGTP